MNKFTPYEIVWLDIKNDNDWKDFKDTIKPAEVKTVGYFVEEHEDYYLFCEGFSDDEQYFAQTAIPKGVIKSIKQL